MFTTENAFRAQLAAQFRPDGCYGQRNNMERARTAAVAIHNGETDPQRILAGLTPAEPPKVEKTTGKKARKRVIVVEG